MKKIFIVLLVLFSVNANSQEGFTPPEEIGIYEKLDSILPDDVFLTDKDSNQVNLKSIIDKPTILSFVYFECPGLCTPLLDGISEVIDRSDVVLGKDYQMITISFNKDDTPKLGQKKKKNYLASIKKQIDASQWIWLTGDSVNIEKITDAVGFKFKRDGEDFLHPASIIAISPKGKVTRYLHGTYFLPFDLKMAVVEAAEEKSGPTINKLLKFCFSYDVENKKYVLNITSISGSLIIILVLVFLFTVLLKKKPLKTKKV
jgi:protein SCO1/2